MITLYRPVGKYELELIRASNMRKFPPRLEFQPIFYPVLTLEYATKIARDWNVNDETSGFEGHVLKFNVDADFQRYKIHEAGGKEHLELWIPAAELEEFNSLIIGTIELIATYHK